MESGRIPSRFLGFFVALLFSSFAWSQYQVVGDPFYNRVTPSTYILQTQYPYTGTVGTGADRKVIEIASGWLDDQTRVQVYFPYAANGSVNGMVQEWQMVPAGRLDGEMSYFIINRWHRRYMQASGLNGQVRALAYNGELNQRWFFDAGPFGQKFIRSAANGLYITFPSSANGANVTMQTLNLGTTQQVNLSLQSQGMPIWALNYNYLKPTIIHLADNPNLVFGDIGQSTASVQNQVIVLQNRVYGPSYQTWDPHTEAWLRNGATEYSNLPGDDGFRLIKHGTGFAAAPWNNFGSIGYGMTTRFWEPNPGAQQRWYVMASRVAGRYTLVHAASGLTVQPQYNGPGALLVLVPFNTDSSQQVTFENLP